VDFHTTLEVPLSALGFWSGPSRTSLPYNKSTDLAPST